MTDTLKGAQNPAYRPAVKQEGDRYGRPQLFNSREVDIEKSNPLECINPQSRSLQ